MKYFLPLFVITLLAGSVADAQVRVFVGPRVHYGYPQRRSRPYTPKKDDRDLPKFEPSVNLSVGYGFPNLDQIELPEFYRSYKGNVTQTGPFTGAIDYQFRRDMSIGIMATHGTVSAPYYNYNDPYTTTLKGSLDNWSVMLDFVKYMPVSLKVTPYLRGAIGVNTWKQNFTDQSGNKVNYNFSPNPLAYQVGVGAKFNLSQNAGIFLEAGYGKYILHGGLAFKF